MCKYQLIHLKTKKSIIKFPLSNTVVVDLMLNQNSIPGFYNFVCPS